MTDIERLGSALEGRYRVERELGEGGMATVYVAEDLKHRRNVALKVLKPELAAVVGGERFLSEIEVTAGLHHPHILPLFDSGEADGFLFYVMPLVEGESLRDRLDRERQLPVEEAVELARKVADALDYAHGRGVVHRDIKPGNILLSERGEPLVADFGIALAVSQAGGGRITETGLSLGTPHYMSPEQASGDRSVDRRSDIYALGCVLYEMLAGEPPYGGPTSQAVLARILTEEARPLSDVRKTVPRHVAATVTKALAKMPADRFASAAAFADALTNPAFAAPMVAGAPGPASAAAEGVFRGRGTASLLAAGAVVAVGALAFMAGLRTAPEAERRVARFQVGVPEEVSGVSSCCGPAQALSPDGEWLVFVGLGGAGDPLYRRRIGQLEAEVIPGTEGGRMPFFSPDGRWVGFHSDGRLGKVPMTGGPPVPVAEVERMDGASWGDNDVIVFRDFGAGLATVPASGGTPTPVPGTEDADYIHPWMLPGGEAALARIWRDDPRIVAVDLATGAADTLGFGTRATYASGYLVVSGEDGTLLAHPFDPETRRTTGQAVAILDGVSTAGPAIGEFALSADGGLVYQSGASGFNETLVLHGPESPAVIELPEPGNYESPTFSPDGRRIAVRVAPSTEGAQIWIWDQDQETQQLLTVEGDENEAPVWTPDGSRVAFSSSRADSTWPQIYWQPADGGGRAELLLETDDPIQRGGLPSQFSPDGTALVFSEFGQGDSDIGLLDLASDTVRWLVRTAADDYHGQISPDGRWLAYTSDRSGQPEIYVQALDGTGGRTQVSAGGGSSPRWAPDGATLYFATGEGRPVVAARVGTDGGFRVLSREAAFEGIEDLNVPGTVNWDVGPDGKEFVYIGRGGASASPGFVWILGWPEIVRRMTAGERR